MAIVFDTKAELEAFCEAFELKSLQQERSRTKAHRRFSKINRMVNVSEPANSDLESFQLHESVPAAQSADVDTVLLTELTEEFPLVLASAS